MCGMAKRGAWSQSSSCGSTYRCTPHFLRGVRVCPEEVLRCVQQHQLFAQAEACLRHRFPGLEQVDGVRAQGCRSQGCQGHVDEGGVGWTQKFYGMGLKLK